MNSTIPKKVKPFQKQPPSATGVQWDANVVYVIVEVWNASCRMIVSTNAGCLCIVADTSYSANNTAIWKVVQKQYGNPGVNEAIVPLSDILVHRLIMPVMHQFVGCQLWEKQTRKIIIKILSSRICWILKESC